MEAQQLTTNDIEFIQSYTEPTTISRRELFDETNYKKIVDNAMIDKMTQKKLQAYFKDRKEPGVKETVYNTSKHNIIKSKDSVIYIGRLYPVNGISNMRRDIRNPLTERFYWDLDFVNAHYHLALHLCQKVYEIPNTHMKEYVENREVWLTKTHPDRKVSKQQFLALAFGNSVKNYDEEFEVVNLDFEKSAEVSQFLQELKQEFNGLARAVWSDSTYQEWKKIKSGKENIPLYQQPNAMFKLLAKVLQDMERQHLLFLSSYLEINGRYMGVYIHDGGLIEKLPAEKEFDDMLRKKCEDVVNHKFGSNMKLLIKPIEYSLSDFSALNKLDAEVMERSKIDGYDMVKKEFEERNFFVNDITAGAEVDEKDEYFELIVRPKQKLFDRYAPMTYKEYTIKDGEIKTETKDFISKWFKDESRRTYKKIDFIPSKKETPDVFNTFKGLRAEALCEKYPEITKEYATEIINGVIDNDDYKRISFLREHIMDLCGNDEKMYLYLVQWLAFIVQKRVQPQTALVFISKQGVGKDVFWNFIYEFIIGKKMVSTPSKLEDVVGKFSGPTLDNKLLVHINETKGKDTFASSDEIKQLIAGQPTITVENKGKDKREITNNLGFIFLSNNENPIKIEESDRRWCIFECSNKWVELNDDDERRVNHFTYLTDILKNDEEQAERLAVIFYLFLQNIDLSSFNIRTIPKSAMYNEMKKSQLHIMYYWLKDICEHMESSGKSSYDAKGNDLYQKFIDWKNFAGHSKYEMTLTKFGIKLKDFDFITKARRSEGISYKISHEKLVAFLKSKDLYEEIFTA
jgi:phage/plasmid-associated DNA primase